MPLTPPPNPMSLFIQAVRKNSSNSSIPDTGSNVLKKFYHFARWFTRSEHPFASFENIWSAGLRAHYLENSENLEEEHTGDTAPEDDPQTKFYLATFEKMRSLERFEDAVAEMAEDPSIRHALIRQMDLARGNACSSDAHTLKKVGPILAAQALSSNYVDPPIDLNGNKEEYRGWKHPQFASLLVPAKYALSYLRDPDSTIAQILDGSWPATGELFPAFLYPNNGQGYSDKNIKKGLFRGHFWLLAYKVIFTGPGSAGSIEHRVTHINTSQAIKHNLCKVTPETIAYAALHAYFSISSAREWRTDMGNFSKEVFFETMVRTLSRQGRWQTSLFQWANELIFGHKDGAKAPQAKKSLSGPSDLDLFLQQSDEDEDEEDDERDQNADEDNAGDQNGVEPFHSRPDSATPEECPPRKRRRVDNEDETDSSS